MLRITPFRSLKPALSSPRTFTTTTILQARILPTIKAEHSKLRDEYKKIKSAANSDEKDRWRNQFSWDLARHSIGEEIIVYPQFETHLPNGKEMADRDRAHHYEVKVSLAKVQDMDVTSADFDPELDKLMKSLENHIKEEEEHDLPALEEKLSIEASDDLSGKFERTKMFVPTKSHPTAPDKPPYETVVGMLTTPIDLMRDMFKKFPKEARK
ncbi:HHE domain protein [Delitschia confertaspora ATCC 74209]|uniref:HHE domain protein n=1 Tax=Delitschia confertaspora ATCC 74209 TaxID=1513339 RepID=A0A9P4MMV4_9PLEO|nr:HHE domain protein [Delitschia confertaspora ATCC 74209]